MGLRSWFRRRRGSAPPHPADATKGPRRPDPPLLPGGEAGHVVLTWKYEDEFEGDEGIGPVWVERYAEPGADEPFAEVVWDEWLPFSEAREYARSHGYEFNAG